MSMGVSTRRELPLQSTQANKTKKAKPFPNGGWLLALAFLTVLYLVVEVIFNTSLVTVTSGDYDPEATERLELFGRTVSGVGFVLLFWGWLASRGSLSNLRNVIWALPASLVLWFAVFAGQKWLVDHFLVDPSSVQVRQQAAVSQLFKGAVSARILSVKGGQAFVGEIEDDPSQKVYFSLLSGLSFFDKALVNNLGGGLNAILDYHVNQELDPESARQFAKYESKMRGFVDEFNAYQRRQKDGEVAVNKAIDTRDAEYAEALRLTRESFAKYQRDEAEYYRLVDSSPSAAQISNLQKALDQYARAERANKPDRMSRTVESYNKEFSKAAVELGTYAPPLTYWYEDLQEGALSTGIGVVIGALAGDPGSALVGGVANMIGGRAVSSDPAYYRRKLREHLGADPFKGKSGIDSNIRTFEAFVAHPRVIADAVANARKSNLSVRSDWQVTDKAEFMRAYDARIGSQRNEKVKRSTRVGSCNVPVGLSSEQFYRDACVQQEIRRRMGTSTSVVIVPGWSQQTFDSKLMSAKREEAKAQMRRLILAEGREFADGGKYAEEGKNALRATLIPPISMGLSLFLILLSVSGLPGKVLLGLRSLRHRQVILSSPNAVPNFKAPRTSLFTVVCLLLILFAPFLVVDNRFSDSSADVQDFFGDIRTEVGAPLALAMDWTLRTQPLIQPAGEALESKLGIREIFDRHNAWARHLDERQIPLFAKKLEYGLWMYPHSLPAGYSTPNRNGIPLYFIQAPDSSAGSRVQILNIRQKYRDGLFLKPGFYDVLIEASGYEPLKERIAISPRVHVFEYRLKPLSDQ